MGRRHGRRPGFRAAITADSVEWGNRALAVHPRHTGSVVTGLALAGAPIAPPPDGSEPEPAVTRGARSLLRLLEPGSPDAVTR